MDLKKKRLLHNPGNKSCFTAEKKLCMDIFSAWSSNEQVEFMCHLLSNMSRSQQSQVNSLLEPLLRRDFIVAFRSSGVPHLAEMILSQLDALSLLSVELVSHGWQWSVAEYQLWRRLILRRISADPIWYGMTERRGWLKLLNLTDPTKLPSLLQQRFSAAPTSLGHQKLLGFPLSPDAILVDKPPDYTGLDYHRNPHSQRGGGSIADSSALVNIVAPNSVPLDLSKPDNRPPPLLPSLPSPTNMDEIRRIHAHLSSSSHDPPTPTDSHDADSFGAIVFAHRFYKQLYPRIIKELKRVEQNWARGNYHLTRIPCRSDVTKGVYCLQYDEDKIVSGLRDDTIKVWRRVADPPGTNSAMVVTSRSSSIPTADNEDGNLAGVVRGPISAVGEEQLVAARNASVAANRGNSESSHEVQLDGYHCTQILEGHTGSVLCLQYIGNLLISGSSDTTVRLWDLSTGRCLNVVRHHAEAVLHLRFRDNILVTCSKDRNIAVWDMGPWPRDVQLRQILVGHRAAVNVVDFDEKYIVSASGDRTIKVWDTSTCTYVRTLTGHRRGIACLQYRDRLVVSGSSDNTIRIWDIETGVCFRVLEGHEELVRCIRFDNKHIVSGAYDGKIKIWSLKHALDPRSKPNTLCLHTLQQHTGRVFRLQFDDFQIVSSSHDDTILIWDFAHPSAGTDERDDGFDDGIHTALIGAAQTGSNRFILPNVSPNATAAPPPSTDQPSDSRSSGPSGTVDRSVLPPPVRLAITMTSDSSPPTRMDGDGQSRSNVHDSNLISMSRAQPESRISPSRDGGGSCSRDVPQPPSSN